MAVTVLTTDDLIKFKSELIEEFKKIISSSDSDTSIKPQQIKWLKSHQVQRLLGISPGTLQNLRINGTIPYTKIGGVIFYSQEDINLLMQKNKRNAIKK